MKLMNFQIDEDLHQELKLLAIRENRKIKQILIEQIKEYIKIHKDGNPQHLMTNYTQNEDFMGFPSMAIDLLNKKAYIKNLNEKLSQELFDHVCEWQGLLSKK